MTAVAGGAMLIDVREQHEWDAGHSPEACLIPLSSLDRVTLPEQTGRTVMVICRSGNRSQGAAAHLRERGLEAYSVDGGMQDWLLLGGTVVDITGSAGRII